MAAPKNKTKLRKGDVVYADTYDLEANTIMELEVLSNKVIYAVIDNGSDNRYGKTECVAKNAAGVDKLISLSGHVYYYLRKETANDSRYFQKVRELRASIGYHVEQLVATAKKLKL